MYFLLKILKPYRIMTTLFSFMSVSAFAQEPAINTFPYTEDFEADNGGWTAGGTNSSWEWGWPRGYHVGYDADDNGSNAWVTNLDGDYNSDENSWVESPVFDFTAIPMVRFSFDISYSLDDYGYDYAKVQYKVGGGSWQDFTASGSSENWFTENGWDDYEDIYLKAFSESTAMAGQSNVRFRILISSNGNDAAEGVAFDNVRIESIDIDGDGVLDNSDIDIDGDGLTNAQESLTTDTDGDGLSNAIDPDSDNDGIPFPIM